MKTIQQIIREMDSKKMENAFFVNILLNYLISVV